MKMTTIASFQDLVQSGGAAPNGPMGIHGGGHYTISFVIFCLPLDLADHP